MSAASDGRAAVRAAIAAARQARVALDKVKRAQPGGHPGGQIEMTINATAAMHRAVRLILEPACLVALSAVAGPFLDSDGEDA
jgi:hypothetical protein